MLETILTLCAVWTVLTILVIRFNYVSVIGDCDNDHE